MTTEVTVRACCSDDKEVVINKIDIKELLLLDKEIIQNGESRTFYIYDNLSISTYERQKV